MKLKVFDIAKLKRYQLQNNIMLKPQQIMAINKRVLELEKNMYNLDCIYQALYKKIEIKPELVEEIAVAMEKVLEVKARVQKNIDRISGKEVALFQLEMELYNNKINKLRKRLIKNINSIKMQIFDQTGWYMIENDCIAKVDVDNNILNAIKLDSNDEWRPKMHIKKNEALEFIDENKILLEQLTNYMLKLDILKNKKQKLGNQLSGLKDERYNAINDLMINKNKTKKIERR